MVSRYVGKRLEREPEVAVMELRREIIAAMSADNPSDASCMLALCCEGAPDHLRCQTAWLTLRDLLSHEWADDVTLARAVHLAWELLADRHGWLVSRPA
jgi:hypothetical protein